MKDPGPMSPATESTFRSICESLATRGAQPGKMFGMVCLKAHGKAFLGVFGDALVFKLTGDAHAKASKLAGATLFDPSGTGRAMKEWVVVPRAHAARWSALASASLDGIAAAVAR